MIEDVNRDSRCLHPAACRRTKWSRALCRPCLNISARKVAAWLCPHRRFYDEEKREACRLEQRELTCVCRSKREHHNEVAKAAYHARGREEDVQGRDG